MTLILLWTGSFESIVVLRQRGAVDLLDAGHELDLRPSLEAARPAAALPDPRLPRDAGGLSRPDGAPDRGGLLPAARWFRRRALGSILAGIPFYYLTGRTRLGPDRPAPPSSGTRVRVPDL